MLFEVWRDNKRMACTDSRNCIDFDNLSDMAKAGFKFKVEGKWMSASAVKKHFDAISTESSVQTEAKPSAIDTKPKRKVRKVYCKETDTVYDNMSKAGKELGIDPAAISYAIQVGRPTTSGYTFSIYEG